MKHKPIIIGLTGGIGMGKSTVAAMLHKCGFPIHHADKVVHRLLKKNGKAVAKVAKLFPQSLRRGAINRRILGQLVFNKPQQLKILEQILHPLVVADEALFIKRATQLKKTAVVLEIPLLFETGAEQRCDFTLCVSAPAAIQKQRVLQRPHMTLDKYRAIIKRQMADKKRRGLADYVITTGQNQAATKQQLLKALKAQGII